MSHHEAQKAASAAALQSSGGGVWPVGEQQGARPPLGAAAVCVATWECFPVSSCLQIHTLLEIPHRFSHFVVYERQIVIDG